MSGYSCLSYSTNQSEAPNGQIRESRAPFRTSRSATRHHMSFPSVSPPRAPPPLPKSAPPLASPALVGKTNGNGMKSLIMEKIERLYGQSPEFESTTFLWKRRTPPPVTSPERIIPIDLEIDSSNGFQQKDEDEVDRSPVQIPIQIHADEGDKIGNLSRTNKEQSESESAPISVFPESQPSLSSPLNSVPVPQTSSDMPPVNKENEPKSIQKDGSYFLAELGKEKRKIEELIKVASRQLNELDPNGEEEGKIRAAIGKANLLINKKFKQFEGLCHTNLVSTDTGSPLFLITGLYLY